MLSACSMSQPIIKTVTITKTQYVLPPSNMITDCLIPHIVIKSNDDLVRYILKLESSIVRCDADFKRLARWRESNQDE